MCESASIHRSRTGSWIAGDSDQRRGGRAVLKKYPADGSCRSRPVQELCTEQTFAETTSAFEKQGLNSGVKVALRL